MAESKDRINVVELKDESMDEDELNSNRRTKDETNSELIDGGRGRGTNLIQFVLT